MHLHSLQSSLFLRIRRVDEMDVVTVCFTMFRTKQLVSFVCAFCLQQQTRMDQQTNIMQ